MVYAAGVSAFAQLQATNHLTLWLKADEGVITNQTARVVRWLDQSGRGNDAGLRADGSAEELPEWIGRIIGGKPAIRFDGTNSVLEIPGRASLQPITNGWSLFMVARRLGSSRGDFPQIIGSRAWISAREEGWAVSFDRSGLLSAHFADGAKGHDVLEVHSRSILSRQSFQLWEIEEDRSAGLTRFYLMGDLDQAVRYAMPTGVVAQLEPVRIGRELGRANSRRANMDLAEILFYNGHLSSSEREGVTRYLSTKYGWNFIPNLLPTVSITSPSNGLILTNSREFTARTAAADSDGSIQRVEFYNGPRLLVTASAIPYSAPLRFLSPGTLSLVAVAIDDRGAEVTSAPVVVTYVSTNMVADQLTITNGLQLWLSADTGVQTNSASRVIAWADRSGQRNHAAPRLDAESSEPPQWVQNAVNGKPALQFDGVDDTLEIANAPSVQPLDGDWTVIFVAKRLKGSQGDFPQIIGSRAWTARADKGWAVGFDEIGLVVSHLADGANGHDVTEARSHSPLSDEHFEIWHVAENHSERQTLFYCSAHLDRTLDTAMPTLTVDQFAPVYLGRAVGGLYNRAAAMQLAEVMVYSRLLASAERDAVAQHLSVKYGIPTVTSGNQAPSIQLVAPRSGEHFRQRAHLSLTATGADVDGRIVKVNFFVGTNRVGTAHAPPFEMIYSNAPPGDLVLVAEATDNLGASTRSAAVVVSVTPPFWRTGWFFTGAGFALALGIAGVVRYASDKRFRIKMRLLEHEHALEKERTRIARDIHDDLGASLTQIGILSELAQRDSQKPAEVQKHAERIAARTRELVQALDEIVWAINPKNDSLDRLIAYILQYAEQFFDSTLVRCRLDVPNSVPKLPLSTDTRHNLFLTVKEAFNNVTKHAVATEVELRVRYDDSALIITVEDNGIGFAAPNARRGNGLMNMEKRLASLGGRFELETQPHRGTRIRMVVPLKG